MVAAIEKHRDALFDLCRSHHVKCLEIFGSATTDEFDESLSDLDFLVDFDACVNPHRFDTYFSFRFALEDLFGRRVDLVEVGAMKNPYFIKRANETRKQIYVA